MARLSSPRGLLRAPVSLVSAATILLFLACSAAEGGETAWQAPPEAAAQKNAVAAEAKSVARGRVVYEGECMACHGPQGRGDGAAAATLPRRPADLSHKLVGQTDGEVFWKITEGRKPMPRFGKRLSEEDRWHLVNYLRTLTDQGAKR
jgi:mono/diheme cytochrome c family protein